MLRPRSAIGERYRRSSMYLSLRTVWPLAPLTVAKRCTRSGRCVPSTRRPVAPTGRSVSLSASPPARPCALASVTVWYLTLPATRTETVVPPGAETEKLAEPRPTRFTAEPAAFSTDDAIGVTSGALWVTSGSASAGAAWSRVAAARRASRQGGRSDMASHPSQPEEAPQSGRHPGLSLAVPDGAWRAARGAAHHENSAGVRVRRVLDEIEREQRGANLEREARE